MVLKHAEVAVSLLALAQQESVHIAADSVPPDPVSRRLHVVEPVVAANRAGENAVRVRVARQRVEVAEIGDGAVDGADRDEVGADVIQVRKGDLSGTLRRG
jgi:hypothetical protein